MNTGRIKARHYATSQSWEIEWRDGRLARLTPLEKDAVDLPWFAPGLMDQQINGFAGVDLQRDSVPSGDLLKLTRSLRRHGCLRFIPTLITDDWERMLRRLRQLKQTRQSDPELVAAMVGWHLEGPFLSRKPGFYGAHNPAWLLDPSPGHLDRLREITQGDPVLLTLAPECPGAIETTAHAVALGFQVSLGHTDASPEILRAALDAGASGFTHLGNGCPAQLHRFDNILWRVLDLPFPRISLVPDGAHMSPALFRLIHRVKPKAGIVYITDAMAAAGAPAGTYAMGRLALEVGEDRVVRLPGTPNLAGSALTPIEGVLRAARMLGCAWREVWPGFSERVAAAWGMPNELQPGGPADFLLLTETERRLRTQSVVAGEWSEPADFDKYPRLNASAASA